MRVQCRYIIPLLCFCSSLISASASSSSARQSEDIPVLGNIDTYTHHHYIAFWQDQRELLRLSKYELLIDISNSTISATCTLHSAAWPYGLDTPNNKYDSVSEHIPEKIRTEIIRISGVLLECIQKQPVPLVETVTRLSNLGYFWHRLEQHEREQPELSQKKINDICEGLLKDLTNPTIQNTLTALFYRGYIFDVSGDIRYNRLDDIGVCQARKIIPGKGLPPEYHSTTMIYVKRLPFVSPNILYSPYSYAQPLSVLLSDLGNGCLADIFDALELFSVSKIIRNRLYKSYKSPDHPGIIEKRLADQSKGIKLLCIQKNSTALCRNNLFIKMTLDPNYENNNDIRKTLDGLINASELSAHPLLPKSQDLKAYTLLIADTDTHLKLKMEIKFVQTHDGYDITFRDLI